MLALGDEDGYFDPTDPSIDKSMQEMLKEINDLFSFEYEFNVRAISSNKPISYVRVPSLKSDNDNAFTQKNGSTLPSISPD